MVKLEVGCLSPEFVLDEDPRKPTAGCVVHETCMPVIKSKGKVMNGSFHPAGLSGRQINYDHTSEAIVFTS